MVKYLAIFVMLGVILAACSHTKKETETYNDGSLKAERYYNMDDGKKELIREVKYYSNKQKEMEGGYKSEKRDGYWVYYYENGNKWSEGYFANGVDTGQRTTYFENGKKRYQGNFKNGIRKGEWRFWDESGVLINKVDYDSIPANK